MDFKEKCKNARAFVVLLAAFIAQILNIVYKRELIESLFIVFVVIVVFIIVSSIAIKLIEKIRNMDTRVKHDEDFSNEQEGNEEDTEG